jgi:hypothetical protein
VRRFKSHGDQATPAENESEGGNSLLGELEKPLRKEASLTYILRKAAELRIDLKFTFNCLDKNGLGVIAKSKFIGMLLDLPLGLNEAEVSEILENDLNFDSYGNVDYNVILNSDMFCVLER